MAKQDEVMIISSSSVSNTNTKTSSISQLNLTPWDLQLLLVDPIQKGLLFRCPQTPSALPIIIDRLKTSFSRALDLFPTLAGRLVAARNDADGTSLYSVHCNKAGANFTHAAAATVSVADISDAKYTPEIVSSLFPLNGVRNFEGVSNPLFGVQVTELADGFFVGCTANHAVVDGTSFWHFINSWAEISRCGSDKISKSPVFDRCFPNGDHAIPIPTLDENNLPAKFVPPPLLERVFHFSRESVAALKSQANNEASSNNISSLQALLAHLLKCLTQCQSGQVSGAQEIHTVLAIGARARIPLPDGYFGNAVYASIFGIGEGELLGNGIGQTGLKINEFVARKASKAVVLGFIDDWVENPAFMRRGTSTFLVSSSPRYDVYGNDFGWGPPVGVRSGKGQKRDGKMTFFPGVERGSIDVEVSVVPETLQALEEDVEFMAVVAPRK